MASVAGSRTCPNSRLENCRDWKFGARAEKASSKLREKGLRMEIRLR